MSSRIRLALLSVPLALLAAGILAWLVLDSGTPSVGVAPDRIFLLAALDVGQADSIFVRSPSGRTMLVDAGNERSDVEKVVLPYLRKQGVSTLDYLVLTHPDQDHVGGMPLVLDSMRVGVFVDSVQPGITNLTYQQTLQRVQDSGVKAVKARRGRTEMDLGEGLSVKVLSPEEPLLSGGGSTTNSNSVVLRLTVGTVSALLCGDLDDQGEKRMLGYGVELRSQILKVAHHGSQGSSSNSFLEAVRPEVALISVGAGNPYGHPQRQLLQRLEAHQATACRTDQRGTIEVTSNGNDYRVVTERSGE